jgi:hypothetical protein
MTAYVFPRVSVSALSVALAIGGVTLLGAQRGGGPDLPPPVTVSFLAVTADGQPLTDLDASDVTLRIGGRTRTIESLRLVEFGPEAAPEAAVGPAADADLGGGTIPPPAPYATNPEVAAATGDVRSVMIAINDGTIRPGTESGLRDAIRGFLDVLGPATRVALVTVPQGQHNVDFTTDRSALETALDQMAGRAPPQMSSEDLRCLTLETLGELRNMLQGMAGASAPTSLVFVSAGLSEAPIDSSSTSTCQVRADDYTVLTRVASAAQAHTFVLQVDGLSQSLRGELGLEALAGATNAQKSLVGNSGDVVLARVASETSVYYEASFRVDTSEQGRDLSLGIEVARAGVTIRAPSSVVFAESGGGGEGGGGGDDEMSPQDMLREARGFADLQLKASASSSRIDPTAEDLRVLALFEPADRSVPLQEAAAGLVTADGRLVAQWTAQPEELTAFPIMAAFNAVPGTYRLRVAATDVEGRRGAVDYDIEVGLHPADTIFISDLALVGPRGGGMAPILEFRDEANAVVYFELYGQPPADLFATIDLLRSMDGDIVTGVQLQAQPSAEADKLLITGTLAIRALDPGDYVVRVTIGRDPPVTLYQTVRKLPPGGN